jgi:hypothetical protein
MSTSVAATAATAVIGIPVTTLAFAEHSGKLANNVLIMELELTCDLSGCVDGIPGTRGVG